MGFLLEPLPAVSAEGRVLPGQVASSSQGPYCWWRPPCKVPAAHQEQFGVQYLAQGRFDMQLSSALSNLPITSRPALPAELQLPLDLKSASFPDWENTVVWWRGVYRWVKKNPETLTPKSHQSHVRSVSDPPLQWSCWFHCSLCVDFHRLCCSAYLLRCSSSSPDPSTTDAQGFYFVAACRSTAERTGSQNLKENLWPLACFLSLPAAYNMNTTMCKQINWRST